MSITVKWTGEVDGPQTDAEPFYLASADASTICVSGRQCYVAAFSLRKLLSGEWWFYATVVEVPEE